MTMMDISMATNSTSQRLPPLIYPGAVSPPRGVAVSSSLHDPGGQSLSEARASPEGLGAKERQMNRSKRELARRHLSNSLQGPKTILPDLRRTQSFSVTAIQSNGVRDQGKVLSPKRETASLGPRRPAHDQDVRAGLRRTHSMKEEGNEKESSAPFLSLSLPQPARNTKSLAALVHELNASMHYSSPSRRLSRDCSLSDDDDNLDDLFAYEDGLDPDLCPGLTGHDSKEIVERTLTPALRKLNRRRVSSRVRTQQWVNQIEAQQRRNERKNRVTEPQARDIPQMSLLFEQEI